MIFDETAYGIYMLLLLLIVAWPARRYLKTIAGTDAKSHLMKLRGKELKSFEYTNGEYIPVAGDDNNAAQQVGEVNLYIEEYTLTISSPYKLKGVGNIKDLVGRKVTSTFQYAGFVTVTFGNNTLMVIDIKSKHMTGPEAMSLHGPGNLIVVWR